MKIAKWSPLGEHALLVHCDDEAAALSLARAARLANWPWLVDVVQAYSSVAVFSSPAAAGAKLEQPGCWSHAATVSHLEALEPAIAKSDVRRHVIPVCYERGLDLDRIAEHTSLDRDAIIRLHFETQYVVYAIGFCPGFPYLGYLPAELATVPRLPSPRVRLPAGSVGLTGRQTGIYTEPRPGGWNIVGQTPLELVNVADGYFPLRTGDEVRFEQIDERQFEQRNGERLPLESRL